MVLWLATAAPGAVTGRREIRWVKGRQEPVEVFEVMGFDEGN